MRRREDDSSRGSFLSWDFAALGFLRPAHPGNALIQDVEFGLKRVDLTTLFLGVFEKRGEFPRSR